MTKQTRLVAERLYATGSVDTVWAFEHYILRLSNKIRELESLGWGFDRAYIKGTKTFRYTLAKAPKRLVEMRIDPISRIATPVYG